MRRFPAAARAPMPWRNGGGETTEVAVFPEGAGLADFDWRVSIARIDRDGPFSRFPGVDRTLTLLSGGPLTLTGPNWTATLSEGSEPVLFDGADAVDARAAEPGTDLNVMSFRERCGHALRLLRLPAIIPHGEWLLIAMDGGVTCDGVPLRPLDAVLVEPGESIALEGPAGARIWSVSISRPA